MYCLTRCSPALLIYRYARQLTNLKNTYKNPSIPKIVMEELLLICTTKCPFRDPSGNLVLQCNRLSMGSPLGPTFASFYMCNIENQACKDLRIKPAVYCRDVDDCFLAINNINKLQFQILFLTKQCVTVYLWNWIKQKVTFPRRVCQ